MMHLQLLLLDNQIQHLYILCSYLLIDHIIHILYYNVYIKYHENQQFHSNDLQINSMDNFLNKHLNNSI